MWWANKVIWNKNQSTREDLDRSNIVNTAYLQRNVNGFPIVYCVV